MMGEIIQVQGRIQGNPAVSGHLGTWTSRYWTYETSRYSVLDISVLEISVLNNKNNLIEFKNFFNFFLHVNVVYFGTE